MTIIDYLLNILMLLTVLAAIETIFIIYLIVKNEFKSTKNKHDDMSGGWLYPRKPKHLIEREKREKP